MAFRLRAHAALAEGLSSILSSPLAVYSGLQGQVQGPMVLFGLLRHEARIHTRQQNARI